MSAGSQPARPFDVVRLDSSQLEELQKFLDHWRAGLNAGPSNDPIHLDELSGKALKNVIDDWLCKFIFQTRLILQANIHH